MEIAIVEITEENKDDLVYIALSMYIGKKCKYCLHEFTSVKEFRERDVRYAGHHEYGRIACGSCWDNNNKKV